MVGPWPHRAFTFRALSKTYGQMWLRCDVCRRYARLKLAGLHDVDYRTRLCKNADGYGWVGETGGPRSPSHARIASINPPTPRMRITRFML